MGRYISKRVVITVATIFAAFALIFFTLSAVSASRYGALIPGDNSSKGAIGQFFSYIGGFFSGRMGTSIQTSRPVAEIIGDSIGVSVLLWLLTGLAALVLGLLTGAAAAKFHGMVIDRIMTVLTYIFMAVPCFVLATYLLFFFCLKLKWFDAWTVSSPSFFLPVISLAAYPLAHIASVTRTAMLDTLTQDYIRAARVLGIRESKVVFVYALRNASLPAISYIGRMFAYIISGSLVVERIFSMGGIGSHYITAIIDHDYPLVLGITMCLAVFIMMINFLCDILYRAVNPRLRRSEK